MSRHELIEYQPNDPAFPRRAWCTNPKHTGCRGVLFDRIGSKWYHPRDPRPELLLFARGTLDGLADLSPTFVGIGVLLAFAACGVLLAFF